MDSAKSQLIDRLKTANSVLVTVSRNPSVDQLAACIGLTLLVNKLKKHGSAVFSGQIPSTIEFLKPEDTIEKTADSLRDFIIALDKNKADKLRYKVEDETVKIFITPYKASLSDKDLEFSQGDFNVELVIALGVNQQDDLDEAIVSHGRILHDATVASITTAAQSNLGSISWRDPTASSLCELVTDLSSALGEDVIDEQIATALLTGVIAETDRFSNQKTTSQTMSVSAKLMAAGANQQLVATNLDEPPAPVNLKEDNSDPDQAAQQAADDGTLSIKHDAEDLSLTTLPPPTDDTNPDQGSDFNNPDQNGDMSNAPKIVTQPPALGGTLTANTFPEQYDPSIDPLSGSLTQNDEPTLTRARPFGPDNNEPAPVPPPPEPPVEPQIYTPPPPSWTPPEPPVPPAPTNPEPAVGAPTDPVPAPPPEPPTDNPEPVFKDQTIDQLEVAVDSPHVKQEEEVKDARQQVEDVLAQSPDDKPVARNDLNAEPLGAPLHEEEKTPDEPISAEAEEIKSSTGLDPSLFSEPPSDNSEAPPVPPPIRYPINPDNPGNSNENK